MASYRIVPTPELNTDFAYVKEKLEKFSIRDSEEDLKTGPIPETLEKMEEGILYFEFGFQEKYTEDTLEGEKERKKLKRIRICFLGNGFIAFGYCKKNEEEEILKFLEEFVSGYSLNTLTFEEKSLRKFIDEAPDILMADFSPKEFGKPEQVSASDRTLEATELWQDYEREPISKIKVNLPGEEEKVRVGFDKYGKVIFYRKAVSLPRQLRALKRIVDEVISKYVDYSYQAKLEGENKWS